MATILGLDIGVGSVGWGLIEDGKRIIDLGVRTFSKAETAKEGKSLNLIRRESRLSRRRIYRRAERLNKLLNFLIQECLISKKEEILLNPKAENPWILRSIAVNNPISKEQLARIIYHICKHRGFYWSSSAELNIDDNGKIKDAISTNQELMAKKGYATIGQMIACEFPNCCRNKQGSYNKAISRVDLDRELRLIFNNQKEMGNHFITEELINGICGTGDKKTGYLWMQKPALQGDQLLDMVGHCRFEREEKRAPVSTYLAERHVWLTKLINLRIKDDNSQVRGLDLSEINILKSLPYEILSGVKYKKIKDILIKNGFWTTGYSFIGIDYQSSKKKDPEDAVFYELKGWHKIASAISKVSEQYWEKLSKETLNGHSEEYDFIASTLTIYKEDEDIRKKFAEKSIPNEVINSLLTVRFQNFSALSLKALSKIIPFMEQGLRYDESCDKAGYKHYLTSQDLITKTKFLPPLFSGRDKNGTLIFNEALGDIPRNPVVLRAINQTRKVVNAVIKKYGSPSSIHIELARDLAKSFDERKKIEGAQKENRDNREKTAKEFIKIFGEIACNGRNLEKFRLYKEQDCKSFYSGKKIDIQRLLEPGYVEVDHALPYSRSFDDSQTNKVLVLSKENQDKGNRTPFEYFESFNLNWDEFFARVKNSKTIAFRKKEKVLMKTFDKNEDKFKDRNLNDTRYITKFVKNYIDNYLLLNEESTDSRCVVVAGLLTDLLRKKWGLTKNRSANDRHHALDAVVVACCSRSIVQLVGTYYRQHEIKYSPDKKEHLESELDFKPEQLDFPVPWKFFRDELVARLTIESKDELLTELKQLFPNRQDSDLSTVRPLFVSKMCEKKGKGALHEDTIRRQTEEQREQSKAVSKLYLVDIKLEDITPDNLVDYERNKNLYEAIKRRILKFYDIENPKTTEAIKKLIRKEFTENPFHMPNKRGVEQADKPIVYSIRTIKKVTGVPVRNGVAKNEDIYRVDVFKKNGKYYLIPVYSWNTTLPNRAVVSDKNIADWDKIDDSFDWCFSMHKNEMLKIVNKKISKFLYFVSLDVHTGAIKLINHDQSNTQKKENLIRIGVKTADILEKYYVDVLGFIHKAQKEERLELA